jgi:hypothetical protein
MVARKRFSTDRSIIYDPWCVCVKCVYFEEAKYFFQIREMNAQFFMQ